MFFIANNAEETRQIGYSIAKMISNGELSAKFIALRGEMGVGKTLFTSGFASFFGITGVKSPTYTVVNQYGKDTKIYHFDMYRIESEDDLYSIGYDDYLAAGGYIIVEWSENIEYAIPDDAIFITLERCAESEDMRKITVTYKNQGACDDNISI